jgi:hypothetical protein
VGRKSSFGRSHSIRSGRSQALENRLERFGSILLEIIDGLRNVHESNMHSVLAKWPVMEILCNGSDALSICTSGGQTTPFHGSAPEPVRFCRRGHPFDGWALMVLPQTARRPALAAS